MIAIVLIFGFITCVLTYICVDRLRSWAERSHLLDIPNERSSHSQPTPRGGGLVIVILSTIGLVTAWLLYPAWPLKALLAFLGGAWLIAAVCWWDDVRSLPVSMRLITHSLSAILIILVFGFWRVVDIPLVGLLDLKWLGLVITFLWLVGLTNAYNFMDGIDGMAGGQAVVAGIGWMALGVLSDQSLIGILGILLAASSLGFLGHNWPPARIFMGDVGSSYLGYMFAALAIIAAQDDPRLMLAGLLLVWSFIFDAAFTFMRRLLRRENVLIAHRSHLYQRLVIAGYSHRFVTLLYLGLALVGAILALLWYTGGRIGDQVVLLTIPLLCVGLWRFTVGKEQKSVNTTNFRLTATRDQKLKKR